VNKTMTGYKMLHKK